MKLKSQNAKRITFYRQDLGILALFAVLFAGALIVIDTPTEMRLEFIVMLLVTFFCMLFAAFRMTMASVVLTGVQITIYTTYKVFFYYSSGETIQLLHFVWIFYPLLSIAAVNFFINGNARLEAENIMLKDQVSKLVLIDPLTGLYNLKGLYLDLQGQIGLAARKGIDITLMIVALRYEAELKKVLGTENLDIVKQRLAAIVQDIIRIEDRVYAIDDKGTLAIILSCDAEGAEMVKRRVKEKLTSFEAMPEIVKNKVIRIDLQFGYLQYDKETFGRDLIRYKQCTESELQYDV